jgi:hypothetical protein
LLPLIPADHPIRRIRAAVDVVLESTDDVFDGMNSAKGSTEATSRVSGSLKRTEEPAGPRRSPAAARLRCKGGDRNSPGSLARCAKAPHLPARRRRVVGGSVMVRCRVHGGP